MPRKPVVAVVGSGSETEPAISNARELGRLIAERNWVLITGGRNAGVMRAANKGSKLAESGLAIGVLPDNATKISSDVDVAIITDVGEARNNIIVLSADVVIACGVDDPGTASEVSLALKAEKPVVFLGANSAALEFFSRIVTDDVKVAQTPGEAIERAENILTFHQ